MTESLTAQIAKAKEIDLVSYLLQMGCEKETETGSVVRFYSPLRNEKVASFVVSKRTGKWRDFGNNESGDIIDVVQKVRGVKMDEALNILLTGNAPRVKREYVPIEQEPPAISISYVGGIVSPHLMLYLSERKISPVIAQKWLVELGISFTKGKHPDKVYRLLGWKNDSGGFEMRNRFFKVSNSPKNITTIRRETSDLALFEGWPDFLTALSINKITDTNMDVIVLNSLSFLSAVMPWLKGRRVYGYLDNDEAGDDAIQEMSIEGIDVVDCRGRYKGFKDFNDKITDGKFTKV